MKVADHPSRTDCGDVSASASQNCEGTGRKGQYRRSRRPSSSRTPTGVIRHRVTDNNGELNDRQDWNLGRIDRGDCRGVDVRDGGEFGGRSTAAPARDHLHSDDYTNGDSLDTAVDRQ